MLTANQNGHCLHGGHALDKRVWDCVSADDKSITFSCFSPDGEEGFPGNMTTRVTYSLKGAELKISYSAISDAKTPICLTNHSYFNLNGFENAPATNHTLTVFADRYTVVDDGLIPTGERRDVTGTPYDLRTPTLISSRFTYGFNGYDTNFHLQKKEGLTFCRRDLCLAGKLDGEEISLTCYTDMPCMQIYTAGFLGKGPDFKGGVKAVPYHAVCLETQYEPDAVNHGEGILRVGNTFHHTTVYKFTHR
jgi:aldose 1-epimerase